MKLVKVILCYEKSETESADTPATKEIVVTKDAVTGVQWPREVRLTAMILNWFRDGQ